MKGVVFTGNRQLEIQNFPDPTPGPGEVVLEIKASGMCGSDLKLYRAPPGAATAGLGLGDKVSLVIAGHEPCGLVAAVGAGVNSEQVRVGMRVMQHHYRGCAGCPQCSAGWMQLCETGVREIYGVTGHGAHAQYMKCPARTLMPLPEELSFSTGAAIACGTGTAWGALQRLGLMGDQTIAIFGQGPVGLSATLLAARMGARVIALDVSPERLQRAKEFGADEVINPAQTPDVVQAIRSLTHGLGAHAALEASSAPSARRQAVQGVRTWGKVSFVGEGGELSLDVSSDMIRRQVTLMGSWTFSVAWQTQCAQFIADRKMDIDQLFTDHWRLDQAVEAYQHFDKQAGGKGVFLM
jgi:threonine dehydrogenase-like Zn-dependent dehydrogenase